VVQILAAARVEVGWNHERFTSIDECNLFDSNGDTLAKDITRFFESITPSILDYHAPIVEMRSRRATSMPWWTPSLSDQWVRTRKAFKQWINSRISIHHESYKHQRNQLHRLIETTKRSYLHDRLVSVKNEAKKMWSLLDTLTGRTKTLKLPNHNSAIESTNSFNEFFLSKVRDLRNRILINVSQTTDPDEYFTTVKSPLDSFIPATEYEVKRIIMKSPCKTSPLDVISTWLLAIHCH
jgi:hypothetical protein